MFILQRILPSWVLTTHASTAHGCAALPYPTAHLGALLVNRHGGSTAHLTCYSGRAKVKFLFSKAQRGKSKLLVGFEPRTEASGYTEPQSAVERATSPSHQNCVQIQYLNPHRKNSPQINADSTVIPYEYDGRRTDGVRRTQTYTASVFAVREQ